jgi:hypothetical protein
VTTVIQVLRRPCAVVSGSLLISALACGPDLETTRREKGQREAAANLNAAADRLDAEVAVEEAELAHMKAIDAMYERKAWAKLLRDGTLSSRASNWLRTRAAEGGEVESIIHEGRKIVDFTKPLSAVLNEATDDAHAVEPFAVKVDAHRVKSAIAAMARVETVDRNDIGFTEIGQLAASEHEVAGWGYLVAWFHQGALVGFVYQSKQALELDALVAETSPLVERMRTELPKRP